MSEFEIQEDIELTLELLNMNVSEFSDEIGVSRMTLNRWIRGVSQPSRDKLEALYGFIFSRGIKLNEINAQLFIEEMQERGLVPLFHGSKDGIRGKLSLACSHTANDFDRGFYCGESLAQSTMFVARYPKAISYFIGFEPDGLTKALFGIDRDWMLAIAYYRQKLMKYSENVILQKIIETVESADYLAAPIADNRMFETMDSFAEGEITDVQCEHCLSATSLGSQFVLRTEKALSHVRVIKPRYLCQAEKRYYLDRQRSQTSIGVDKAKAARRTYRGQGAYIEELLS